MDDSSPEMESDTAARTEFPRGIVLMAAASGLAVGLVVAAVIDATDLVRWLLVPLAIASVAAVIGFMVAVRRLRAAVSVTPSIPGAQPHQLPRARPRAQGLALGPDPWRTSSDGEGRRAEPLPPDPVELRFDTSERGEPRVEALLHLLSHDGLRYLRPSEHELERARRSVAKIVADLAPQPGAFDAVCERLLAVGESMAQQLAGLDRRMADYEKQLGVDLVSRLSDTRVTETGLAVLTWVRWVRAALHPDGGAGAMAFYDPVAVAMASRYGGTSEQWHAVMAEPVTDVELGGVVEKIALAIKAEERSLDLPPDPDAVDRILEAPQWM